MIVGVMLEILVGVCLAADILWFVQVSVERGMSWEDATHIWAEHNGTDDGFYVQVRKCF